MNRVIIACRTLEKELLTVMEALSCTDPIIWLEAGAHNIPRKRLESVREALGSCEGYDTVLLAMTFCGNSLAGLESGTHNLVLPCFDDCIPLLLGSGERKQDTYYLTDGWLAGEDNLLKEYERTVQKYGQSRGDRIFSSMLRHYRQIVWLTDSTSPAAPDHVKKFADRFDLMTVCRKTDPVLLYRLIKGDWDDEFVLIPPDSRITLEMRKGEALHV